MRNNLSNEAQRYLYSLAAASRIFACPTSHVLGLQVWHKVIWLYIKGQRPFLVSKEVFKTHFVLWRRVQGKRLREAGLVRQESQTEFSVLSQRNRDFYLLSTRGRSLTCSCADFAKQIDLYGKGCCKHGYAVLQTLGHGTLQDFVAA